MIDRPWILDGVVTPGRADLVPYREAVALGYELDDRAYQALRAEHEHYLETRYAGVP